jgi:hypothetical protein
MNITNYVPQSLKNIRRKNIKKSNAGRAVEFIPYKYILLQRLEKMFFGLKKLLFEKMFRLKIILIVHLGSFYLMANISENIAVLDIIIKLDVRSIL